MNPHLFHLKEEYHLSKNKHWLTRSYIHAKEFERKYPDKAKELKEKVRAEMREKFKNYIK